MGRRPETARRSLTEIDEARERYALASRLHACREEEGLTLLELAERSGVAPSTIHKVERGQMMPTISVLMKIVRGLRRPLSHFIGDEGPAEVAHVPAERRSAVMGRRGDVRVERLAGDIRDARFDVYAAALPPGKGSGRDPYQHPGEKFAFCLQGTVVFHIGNEQYTLRAGDALHFKSTIPHSYRNPDRSREARLLLVGSVGQPAQSGFASETRGKTLV
jgi:transcriptional regulator with XRE-family HTH domain